ncbi:internal virion protein with endolysin domain [Pseudomonas phage VSW-3]|uniref:Internal virion protein n=1 Tax=Pseudomonas phage VSW-3 TaxID=1852562 RepID=A0A173GCP9_9CAUD|nr:internal virion protein with endolysin domain [Pseudomonas phage VSW-3]ANH51102.1 hypothetical protein VSW3_26 [Pseudomonas phage VSW-3]
MDLMNTRPADIKASIEARKTERQVEKAAEVAAKPTPLEKQAVQDAQTATFMAASVTGIDDKQAMAQATAVREAALNNSTTTANMIAAALPGDAEIVDVAAGMAKAQEGNIAKAKRADETSFVDQVGAGFSELTAIPALLRTLERPDADVDPNFDYMAIRDKVEVGLAEEDRQFLRESVNEADLKYRMGEVQSKQERMQTLGAHGTGIAVAASLTGGLVDPVGLLAGLGVGKAAQLTGIGARVALAQGQIGRSVAYGALEGAAGNVLTEAAIDAAGGHVTYSDYVTSAAFGAVFGQLHFLTAPRRGGEDIDLPMGDRLDPEFVGPRTPKEAAEDLTATAQQHNMDLYSEAQGRLSENATPEEIRTEVDNIMREQADQVNRIAFSEVPEQDRLFPTFDLEVREDGTVPQIDEVMKPAAERIAVSERWGINQHTVEDGTERKMLGEIAARAEGWAAANPNDPARVNSILARVPWLASSGLTLARSENPVARMVAGVLLESTTGASGRRRTAAITKTMRERVYLEDLVGYEESYKQWRKTNGGSAYRDVLGSDHRSSFDRLVAADRENRRLGVRSDADANVRRAGDHLDAGYDRMRRDQQTVGTIGAQRLGDTSIGYAHRALSSRWVMQASNAEINALSHKLAEQLQVGWDDVAFARQIATRYVERARTSAYGGTAVPANLASPEASSVLRDVLRSMSVGEKDIELAMGRFSRGGASHTKKRLDLDLSEHIEMPDGKSFPLMNAFETDQAGLYLQYARRVSGDIALTQYGVHGDQGMKVLRKSMEYGPDGKRATASEMEAFDQVAAEFFGRPMDGTGNKHLGNLRMLTASSRLGGMAFTQFAEMANSVSLLGVTGALKNVAMMPKLVHQVYKKQPSELLKSIELIGGPLGQDHRVVFPFQEPNDIKVYGRDSLNAFDRMVRAGSNALPWMSGWHHVHAAQVRGISEQIVHKAFRYIRNGEENAALTSMGLSPELAARIKADLPNIATFDEAGNLASLNLTRATDHAAAAELVQAVHRGGKQIIQGTYIGETGKWAHNDLMRMLVQFRSFTLTSMEKQWTRQRSDVGTAKAFGLLMGQMAFALPIHLTRVMINATGKENSDEYLETQLHPGMLARAVLNYTSISGLAGDVLDAGASLTGFEATGVRSGSSSVLGNIPSLGYVESAAKAVTQRDAREAIRMLPGGNLPFLTPIVNTLTD